MGQPTYSSNSSRVARPTASSWADQQSQDAEDQWNAQGQGVYGGVGAAQDYYGQTQQGTNSATSALANFQPGQTPLSQRLAQFDPSSSYSWMNGGRSPQMGQGPNNVGNTMYQTPGSVGGASTMARGYQPSAQQAFDPSAYYGNVSGQRNMYNTQSSAPRTAADALQQYSSSNLAGYDSTALKNFSSADVSGFDPTKYGQTFASGAYGSFQKNLQLQLDKLQNASVAAGRTNTNLYDRDTGRLVNQNANDFSNALAQESGVFSGQKLNALTSGAQMRESAASGIDSNMLSRAQGMDANMLSRAQGMDANTIRQNEFGQNLAAQYDSMNTGADLTKRGQDIGMADSQSGRALARAQGIDQSNLSSNSLAAQLEQSAQEFNAGQVNNANQWNLNRAGTMDANALSRDTANLGARTAYNQQRLTASGDQARLGFERGNALDTAANTRAYQNDALTLQARTSGLSSALQRESMGQAGQWNAQGRADAYTSASRNWANNANNTAWNRTQQTDAQNFAKKQYTDQQQAAIDAKKKTDLANTRAAQAVGAPYYG